jgi:hypothetical protein
MQVMPVAALLSQRQQEHDTSTFACYASGLGVHTTTFALRRAAPTLLSAAVAAASLVLLLLPPLLLLLP